MESVMSELLEYYREQGAPEDQQMLIALLREAQEQTGGVLKQEWLDEIAAAYGVKPAILQALIRRIPGLRTETAPHRLEICGRCPQGQALAAFVEKAYAQKRGFTFTVTGCMKNCRKGPSLKWDGELYSRADQALLRRLIEGKNG